MKTWTPSTARPVSASVTLARMVPVPWAAMAGTPTHTTIAAPQMRAEAILRSGDVISTSLGMGTACPIAAGTKVALTACPWCDDTQPQQVLRLQHGWPGGPDAPMYWRLPPPPSPTPAPTPPPPPPPNPHTHSLATSPLLPTLPGDSPPPSEP